eukprot:CAMPEP_0195281404 /NCGR_PEP_ID=MMETSP0707-20130614/731_1 /TAXON_ID=33640 /ORGANISM="Asterionellopsis glacialis, Strain CCMP134" /LENGTH=195 /DNA_ID=CAMNT_0040340287 /DNA_START=80 /DNA_END=667 /DNA_ORIENTATION=-
MASSSTTSAASTIDFTFRVIESIAFSLHAILGITEPCTGCLKNAFQDHNNMVWWGWPVAGCGLAFVAFGNFAFQDDDMVLLALQWYIVTFHFGAIWYHIRLGHHPVVGMAPGIFIPLALTVIATRLPLQLQSSWWYLLLSMSLGTMACAAISFMLCRLLVKAPASTTTEDGEQTSWLSQPLHESDASSDASRTRD